MPKTYAPDPAARAAAETLSRCRAVHARITAELTAGRAELRDLEARAPQPFDSAGAALALARAEAEDAVHGTATAAALAEQQRKGADALVAASDEHTARLTELRRVVADREVALLGVQHVLDEANVSSKAATAAAAVSALSQARKRYRAAALQVLNLASDVWALETLTQLATWPDSRALSTRFAEVPLPAFGSFVVGDADLREVGGDFNPLDDTVRLRAEQARVQALADLHIIRDVLEGVEA